MVEPAPQSLRFQDKIQRVLNLKPKIKGLMRNIQKGLRSSSIERGKSNAVPRRSTSRHSQDANSYHQLQHSRFLYQRMFMDDRLDIGELNISENPKLKEMNLAMKEKNEKNNKLVEIFSELLDNQRTGRKRFGNAALSDKLRFGVKDKSEKFSRVYIERVQSPDFLMRKRKVNKVHSRCESCLSKRVTETFRSSAGNGL